MAITHAFVNLHPDGPDATLTRPSDWNAVHIGTATPALHNVLDSTVHGDALTGGVVDGDTIIGNATPRWSRLAISIPATNVLRNVFGVDNGDLRPSWKAALDATNPTSVSVGGAASPGTSLIFAHRDHAHGAPATWIATAHNVFSTIHGDTTGAASPVDGDVIIGNVTPRWSKLAISIPVAGQLNYFGVNNAELRPSWKGASNNPGAAAAILASDIGGGLQLTRIGIGIAPIASYPIYLSGTVDGSVTAFVSNLSAGTAAIASNLWSVGALVANQSVSLLVFGENYGSVALQKSASFYANPGLTNGIALLTSADAPIKFFTLSLLRFTITSTVATFTIPVVTTTLDLTGVAPQLRFPPSTATTGLGNYMYWQRSSDGWSPAAIGQIYGGAGYKGILVFATNPSASASNLTEAMRINDLQHVGIGAAPLVRLHVNLADATTNVTTEIVRISHNTSGVPAASFGSALDWYLKSSTTVDQIAARIKALWNDATHASRYADLVLSAYGIGTEYEFLRGRGGAAAMISVLGATPIARYSLTGDLRQCLIDFGFYTTGGASPLDLNGGAITATGNNTLGQVTISDAKNIIVGTITGTQFGTAANQKLALYGGTPIVRGAALTVQLTTITHTAPGTPDYAIQDFAQNGGAGIWGFTDHNEANTLLSVILNLQVRVAELENRLSSIAGINAFA